MNIKPLNYWHILGWRVQDWCLPKWSTLKLQLPDEVSGWAWLVSGNMNLMHGDLNTWVQILNRLNRLKFTFSHNLIWHVRTGLKWSWIFNIIKHFKPNFITPWRLADRGQSCRSSICVLNLEDNHTETRKDGIIHLIWRSSIYPKTQSTLPKILFFFYYFRSIFPLSTIRHHQSIISEQLFGLVIVGDRTWCFANSLEAKKFQLHVLMLRKPENENKWLNSAHGLISFPEPFQQHRQSTGPIDLVESVHNKRENTSVLSMMPTLCYDVGVSWGTVQYSWMKTGLVCVECSIASATAKPVTG